MKKRIICLALVFTVLLSGCNSNTEAVAETPETMTTTATQVETTTSTAKTTVAETTQTMLTTSTAETTKAITTATETRIEADKEIQYKNVKGTRFINGFFTFSTNDGKSYLYNVNNKELIEVDSNFIYYVFDYNVLCNDEFGKLTYKNVKTGEVYFDSKDNLNYMIDFNNFHDYTNVSYGFNQGSFLLYKGNLDLADEVLLGILNEDGTWEREFSSDYKILDKRFNLLYAGNGIVTTGSSSFASDLNVDNLIDLNDISTNSWNAFFCKNYYYALTDNGIVIHDISSNETVYNYENKEWDIDFVYKNHTPSAIYLNNGTCVIIDFNENCVKEFDLSKYDIKNNKGAFLIDDTLMFCLRSENIKRAVCAINSKGDVIVEPKSMSILGTINDKFVCYDRNHIFIYDENGNETSCEYTFSLSSLWLDSENETVLVDTKYGFMIIDLNDLTNPQRLTFIKY